MRPPRPTVRSRPAAVAIAGLTLLAAGLSSCGPSLRHGQRCQMYFERCYAADLDMHISAADKHACWTSWVAHYTIGATEGQRDYARERLVAIQRGDPMPRLPGLPATALHPRAATPVTAVSVALDEPERSAEASVVPDERVERRRRRRARSTRPIPPLPQTANPACAAAACEPLWRTCIEGCTRRSPGCENACRIELNACARGCF